MKRFEDNHGIHRIHGSVANGRAALVASVLGFAFASFAAEPTISVSAQQRYPWNGLVDLNFTITGTSGTKYDTSFTARDMVGNTNIAMKTIYKSNGAAAATKEALLPGNYSWVWDASADLPKDWTNDRVAVTGTAVESRDKVRLWAGGPYWATMNIGATKPEGYGYYFWWGDNTGYKRQGNAWVASDGSSSNFSFDANNVKIKTSFKTPSALLSEGWITTSNVLTPEHDAAHVQWGDKWRLPTYKELSGLCNNNNCVWTWTTKNGVNGYVVRGKGDYASASIFLPAAGCGWNTSRNYAGSRGYYWSSRPEGEGDTQNAKAIYYRSDIYTTDQFCDRVGGFSIRPVQ